MKKSKLMTRENRKEKRQRDRERGSVCKILKVI